MAMPSRSAAQKLAISTLVLGLLLGATPTFAFDEDLYASLLSRYTHTVSDTAGTRVDYTAIRSAPDWQKLITSVKQTQISSLRGRSEQMAFWINVYNILAIDMIVRNEPVASIRDLGSFFRPVWKQEAGRVGNRTVTLDEIEHQILRPMGDPRIHVAIVCASTSCPSLLREPWDAKRLEEQLDSLMQRWMADRQKGFRINRGTRTVYISSIFQWFEEDFDKHGGAYKFIRPYLSPTDRAWLTVNESKTKVEHFDYDWRLNGMQEVSPSSE
jgi:hypothetical protein